MFNSRYFKKLRDLQRLRNYYHLHHPAHHHATYTTTTSTTHLIHSTKRNSLVPLLSLNGFGNKHRKNDIIYGAYYFSSKTPITDHDNTNTNTNEQKNSFDPQEWVPPSDSSIYNSTEGEGEKRNTKAAVTATAFDSTLEEEILEKELELEALKEKQKQQQQLKDLQENMEVTDMNSDDVLDMLMSNDRNGNDDDDEETYERQLSKKEFEELSKNIISIDEEELLDDDEIEELKAERRSQLREFTESMNQNSVDENETEDEALERFLKELDDNGIGYSMIDVDDNDDEEKEGKNSKEKDNILINKSTEEEIADAEYEGDAFMDDYNTPDWTKTRKTKKNDTIPSSPSSILEVRPNTLLHHTEIMSVLTSMGGQDIILINNTLVKERLMVDGMILCTSPYSQQHLRSLSQTIVNHMKQRKLYENDIQGAITGAEEADDWYSIDCGNYIVHIMDPITRASLNLELLWEYNDNVDSTAAAESERKRDELRTIDMNNEDEIEDYIGKNPIPEEYAQKFIHEYAKNGGVNSVDVFRNLRFKVWEDQMKRQEKKKKQKGKRNGSSSRKRH